jgi:hypothetical protein
VLLGAASLSNSHRLCRFTSLLQAPLVLHALPSGPKQMALLGSLLGVSLCCFLALLLGAGLGCCFLAVLLGATLGCAQVLVLVVFLSTVTLLKLPLCHTSRTHAPLLVNSRSTKNMGKHLKNSPEPHRGRKSLFQSCGNHFRTNCSSIWTTFEPHRICNSHYYAGILNRVRTDSNRFRTAWYLQFLLLCWDVDLWSNHVRTDFEPLSNHIESAIPITMLGFRTVFEPFRTGFEPHGLCNSY